MSVSCTVCAIKREPDTTSDQWQRMWIDRFGQFLSGPTASAATGSTGFFAEEEADACGQHHALVLFERYLERGTFAPAEHHNSAVLTTTTHDNATLTH